MPTYMKTPAGKWRVRVFIGRDASGKQLFKSFTAPTKTELKRLVKDYRVEEYVQASEKTVTLFDAAEQYIETCRCTRKSPSTIRGYGGIVHALENDLGQEPLQKLTLFKIQAWINKESQQKAPKTIRNYLAFLSPILALHRPDLKLEALRVPEKRESAVVIPSDKQVSTMLQAAANDEDLYKTILLAAFCGLRRSEICALKWEDIDRREKTISINKARLRDEYNAWIINPVTKTKAGKRVITVDPDVLKQLFARRNASPFVVLGTPDNLYNHYSRTAKRLGIPTRLHYLRHYHCSVLISLGYPERYIIERLGWNSADMIRKVYGHVIEQKQKVLDRGLGKHTGSIMEGKAYRYR